MRAISQEVLGGPEVLSVVDRDLPTLGPSDVLVRVHAAGINPTDWLHRTTGLYLGEPPFVVGWDVWPLEQAGEAQRHGEAGRTTGKLVLTVAD